MKNTKIKIIIFFTIIFSGLFIFLSISKAAIIWGDHFDSAPDFVCTTGGVAGLTGIVGGKNYEDCSCNHTANTEIRIEESLAHGESGKGLRYRFDNSGDTTQTCQLRVNDTGGTYDHFYQGYWLKIPDQPIGGTDASLKMTRFYADNSIIPGINLATGEFYLFWESSNKVGWGSWPYVELYTIPDGNWHSYIHEFKVGEISDGDEDCFDGTGIYRLWVDGILEFERTNIDWGFINESFFTWPGNYLSENVENLNGNYDGGIKDINFDDVIWATTKEDVEDFLGIETQVCEAPAGSSCYYVSIAGDDLNSGSFENPFRTIQHAIDTLNGGDIIYLRGGTYNEKWITINSTKSGNLDAKTIIKSYPGEWAIVDGEHNCFSSVSPGSNAAAVFILGSNTSYVSFENLEITGGGYPEPFSVNGDGASAIRAWGGTKYISIKNCYIHDNTAGDGGGNPAGIYVYAPQNWEMKYNYFKDNGCSPGIDSLNCVGSAMFLGQRTHFTEESAMKNNTFAYNLVEGGIAGFKHKHVQFFGDISDDNSDLIYNDWGDKVHHNIIKPNGAGIVVLQDFVNVYNNIVDFQNASGSGSGHATIQVQYYGAAGGDDSKVHQYLIYNNQVIYPKYGGITLGSFAQPFAWVYNNLIETNDNYWMNAENRDFNIASEIGAQTIDLTNTEIDRNYFFRPKDVYQIILAGTPGKISVTNFNMQYNKNNYINNISPRDSLWQGTSGASQYLTRGEHVLEDSITIANGGIGGTHPYLDGVIIPSYVGATNPEDNDWVEGVLNLTNTSYLMNLEETPDWIEGFDSYDINPPSAPQGLAVQ